MHSRQYCIYADFLAQSLRKSRTIGLYSAFTNRDIDWYVWLQVIKQS